MADNLSIRITADIIELQAKFAVARSESAALTAELNKLARQAATSGMTDQLKGQLNQAAEAMLSAKVKTTDLSNALKNELGTSSITASKALTLAKEAAAAFGVGLSAAAAVNFARDLVTSTAEIENQARVLGISSDALQAYHAAAVTSGAGADVGDAAIRRFTRSLGDAEAGVKKQAEAFRDLGISAAGDTEDVLPQVAAALLAITDQSERARIETALFGKAGQDVNIVLEKWADPELLAHMRELGLVIDQALVKRAHEAEVAFDTFWLKFKAGAADMLLSLGQISQLWDRAEHFSPLASSMPLPSDAAVKSELADRSIGPVAVTGAQANFAGKRDEVETTQALIKFHEDELQVTDEVDKKHAEIIGRMQDELALAKQRNEVNANWGESEKYRAKLSETTLSELARGNQKYIAEIGRMQLEANHREVAADYQAAGQRLRIETNLVDELSGAEQTLVRGIISGRQTLGQVLLGFGTQLVEREIANDLRYMTASILMSDETFAAKKANMEGGFLMQMMADSTQILNDAHVAAANTYATVAAIPYVGPFIAPAAAAVAYGAVAAFGTLSSFDKGTDYVPHDMLAMVHKGEAIVPAGQNTGGFNFPRSGAGTGGQSAAPAVHLHGPFVTAWDTQTGADAFAKMLPEIAGMIGQHWRMNPSARPAY